MSRRRPNIVLMLADDLGFSDLGSYGGEIRTPNIDKIANAGVRLNDFHNSPRCSPSRASLLTGLHPHTAGIGILTADDSSEGGYRGTLDPNADTVATLLRSAGYQTAVRGKWHLSSDFHTPNGSWPTECGFDTFWGTLTGCGSYYRPGTLTRGVESVDEEAADPDFFYTDAIADESVQFIEQRDSESPFFLYVPFTAPHWPLHARESTINHYRSLYHRGWDVLREERYRRQQAMGVIPDGARLSRDPSVPEWEDEPNQEWQAERMSVYAAMVEEMDTAIGRIMDAVDAAGESDNTIFIFLSDNGASDEPLPFTELEYFRERSDIVNKATKDGLSVTVGNDPRLMPGPEDTYQSYGRGWANLSNTPYRRYKLWAHEGGISAPCIISWADGEVTGGRVIDGPYQLTHILPTLLEAVGLQVPAHLPGQSILGTLRGEQSQVEQPLWWEHCGNAAYRQGKWKIVREHGFDWELYDMNADRSELRDQAAAHCDLVRDLAREWSEIAHRVGVIPFSTTLDIYRRRGLGSSFAIQ